MTSGRFLVRMCDWMLWRRSLIGWFSLVICDHWLAAFQSGPAVFQPYIFVGWLFLVVLSDLSGSVIWTFSNGGQWFFIFSSWLLGSGDHYLVGFSGFIYLFI